MRNHFLALFVITGCARGGANLDKQDAGRDGGRVDAPPGGIDAPTEIDAPDSEAVAPLLLTEIALAPTSGELIEIANPSNDPVDLSTYYLSDHGNYFRLPGGVPAVDAADFIVKFPSGSMIPAKGVITIALDTAANFMTTYGAAPTYSIASGTLTAIAANGTASLTNGGELVVLFQWDGQTDLVHDVDLVLAGVPTVPNALIDKSGVALDGPDTNSATTSYKTDARTITPQASAPVTAQSTKRTVPESGHELQTGAGNGLSGDDETSENTAMTWDSAYSAPTPGSVPTSVVP